MSQPRRQPTSLWTFLGLVFDQWMSFLFQSALEPRTAELRAAAAPPPAPATPRPAPPAAPSPPAEAGVSALFNLDDDFVKLVGYSIVSVRRGSERYVRGGSQVVSGRMSHESFVSWMIAKNAQKIDPGEEKYLRVHYTVARRWPREPIDYEENQLRHLDGIRRALTGEPSTTEEDRSR